MYKFRSMPDERNEDGNLLPDDVHLGKFGKALRVASLDETAGSFQLCGKMTLVGERDIIVTTKKKLDFSMVVMANSLSL